jgi:hypothetical protein
MPAQSRKEKKGTMKKILIRSIFVRNFLCGFALNKKQPLLQLMQHVSFFLPAFYISQSNI